MAELAGEIVAAEACSRWTRCGCSSPSIRRPGRRHGAAAAVDNSCCCSCRRPRTMMASADRRRMSLAAAVECARSRWTIEDTDVDGRRNIVGGSSCYAR